MYVAATGKEARIGKRLPSRIGQTVDEALAKRDLQQGIPIIALAQELDGNGRIGLGKSCPEILNHFLMEAHRHTNPQGSLSGGRRPRRGDSRHTKPDQGLPAGEIHLALHDPT
ncbi:hypothetical protein ACVWZR_002405 [Bradyrhizobium sp. i1.3.1]